MPINPQIPLQANAQIDPSQGLNALASAYQYRNQQNRQVKLDTERTEDRAQQSELRAVQLADAKFKSLDDREQRRTRNNIMAAAELNQYLESGNKEPAMSWAQNRRQRIMDAKGIDDTLDTTNIDAVIGLMQKGDWDTLKKHNDNAIKLGQALKFLAVPEKKEGFTLGDSRYDAPGKLLAYEKPGHRHGWDERDQHRTRGDRKAEADRLPFLGAQPSVHQRAGMKPKRRQIAALSGVPRKASNARACAWPAPRLVSAKG